MWNWLLKLLRKFSLVHYIPGMDYDILRGRINFLKNSENLSSWSEIGEFLKKSLGTGLTAVWFWVLMILLIAFLASQIYTRFYRSIFNAIK